MLLATIALSLLLSSGAALDGDQGKPRVKAFTVPAGTALSIELRSTLASDKSRATEQVTGRLVYALSSGDVEVVPVGASVHGSIRAVEPAGRTEPGRIDLHFHVIGHPGTGSRASIRTTTVTFQGERLKKKRKFGITVLELTDARVEEGTIITCSLLSPLIVYIPEQ